MKRFTTILVTAIAAVALAFVLTKRRPSSEAAYTIRFSLEQSAIGQATFTAQGEVRAKQLTDTLEVAGYLQNEATRFAVNSFRHAGTSRSLGYVSQLRKRMAYEESFSFLHVVAPYNASAGVAFDYSGTVGLPEGGGHRLAYTGRRSGFVATDWAILSLAQVLLLPKPLSSVRNLRVRFQLPSGRETEYEIGAGAMGKAPGALKAAWVEELFHGPMIVGDVLEAGPNDVGITVEAPAKAMSKGDFATVGREVSRIVERVKALTGDYTGLSQRRVLLAPVAPDGLSTWVQETAYSSVHPVGENGLTDPIGLAADLIFVSLANSVGDGILRNHPDNWFLAGLVPYYSERVVMATHPGLVNPNDDSVFDLYWRTRSERDFTLGSLAERTERRIGHSSLEIKAAATLDRLDASIRELTAGADSLASFVPTIFALKTHQRIQPMLEAHFGITLRDFFDRYVYAINLLPFEPLPASSRVRIGRNLFAKDPMYGLQDSVAILTTFDGQAYLETCGCKASQAGGVARLAAWVRDFRSTFDGPDILLNLGNAFPMDTKNIILDPVRRKEVGLFLSMFDEIGYDGSVLGESELLFGPRDFGVAVAASKTPYVSANATNGDGLFLPPYLDLAAGDVRVRVVGVTSKMGLPQLQSIWRARTSGVTVANPVPAVGDAMPGDGETDLFVVAGRIKPRVVRELVARYPQIDVVVSYDEFAYCKDNTGQDLVTDPSGFIGETLVLYPITGTYGISAFTLFRDSEANIVAFRPRFVYLDQRFDEDPQARERIDSFYLSEIANEPSTTMSKIGLWAEDVQMGVEFVGSAACKDCHSAEHEQWSLTGHASAFATLLAEHRQYAPGCVVCHVTGASMRSGYEFGDMKSTMQDVQCEMCHGPGSEHVAAPGGGQMTRVPSYDLCVTCHNAEHSDMNRDNFADYYEETKH